MNEATPFAGALRTKNLVGREREKEAIRAAVQAEGQLRILYFYGPGGIGKTRLLEEVPELLKTCHNREACLWSGIIDLYDTSTHSHKGLEQAIIKALDPVGQAFQAYRAHRHEYERLRGLGVDESRLEAVRRSATESFVASFNRLARLKRIILTFDTAESLQYESDFVQQVCGLGVFDLELRSWLLDNVGRMENAVVLFAGRPHARLLEDLQERFGSRLEAYELGDFSEEESITYFDALGEISEVQSIDLETRRMIHYYTGGRPLRLALVIDLLTSELAVPANFYISLSEVIGRTSAELQAIYREVEQQIVDRILNATGDLATTLPYVAWARKGMSRQLLERLTGWSVEKCEGILEALTRFSFVKTVEVSPGRELVFLHDEMYELMNQQVLRGRVEERDQVCRMIIGYYDDQIAAARDPRERTGLMVERLYYQLLVNPREGYAEYARQSDEAIIGHRYGFDMALRDEMLRFFRPDEPDNPTIRRARLYDPTLTAERLVRGSAVRWVRRMIARGQYEEAERVARQIRESNLPPFREAGGDPLFEPVLLTCQAEAMVYRGQDFPGVIRLLQEAIPLLEAVVSRDPYRDWARALHLGRAHNDLGYAYVRLRMYDSAAREYLRALPHLRRTALIGQQATTLNNLAYVYSSQGKLTEATSLCRDALDLWRRERQRFGEGLSLNTLGLIFIERGIFDAARRYCREALMIFEELEDQRGIGLACNALGLALRKEGHRDIHSLQEGEEFFREAEDVLMRGIGIFTGPVSERSRAVEAYNELGCTYRDWARLLRKTQQDPERVVELEQKAVEHLQASVQLALPDLLPEAADSLDDLATLHLTSGEVRTAWEFLQRSDNLIPMEYWLVEGKGIPEIADPISAFWQILGKNALLQGDIAFAKGEAEYQEAMRHYVLACAYFERYSGAAVEMEFTFRHIYDNLRRLPPERLAELRRYVGELERAYTLPRTRLLDIFDEAALGVQEESDHKPEGGGNDET